MRVRHGPAVVVVGIVARTALAAVIFRHLDQGDGRREGGAGRRDNVFDGGTGDVVGQGRRRGGCVLRCRVGVAVDADGLALHFAEVLALVEEVLHVCRRRCGQR